MLSKVLVEAVSFAAELAKGREHEWDDPDIALAAGVGVFGELDPLHDGNGF